MDYAEVRTGHAKSKPCHPIREDDPRVPSFHAVLWAGCGGSRPAAALNLLGVRFPSELERQQMIGSLHLLRFVRQRSHSLRRLLGKFLSAGSLFFHRSHLSRGGRLGRGTPLHKARLVGRQSSSSKSSGAFVIVNRPKHIDHRLRQRKDRCRTLVLDGHLPQLP